MGNLIAIFIGGGLGSLARYGMAVWLGKSEAGFPIGTLGANILACLVLGVFFAVIDKGVNWNEQVKYLLLVGFCGGFSTFSTFSLETLQLFQSNKPLMGILYVSLSVLVCVATLWGGLFLGRSIMN